MKKALLACVGFLVSASLCSADEVPNISLAKNFHYVCSEALVPNPEKSQSADFKKELSKTVNLFSCLYYLRGLSENIYMMQDLSKKEGSSILNNICLPDKGMNDYESLHMFLEHLGRTKLERTDTTRAEFIVALTHKYNCLNK